jgi:hypothetical protein
MALISITKELEKTEIAPLLRYAGFPSLDDAQSSH